MRSAANARAEVGYAVAANCDGTTIDVTLSTGEIVRESVGKYRFLSEAPPEARRVVEVDGFGTFLRWPLLDEDLGVNTILGVTEEEVARAAGFTVFATRDG